MLRPDGIIRRSRNPNRQRKNSGRVGAEANSSRLTEAFRCVVERVIALPPPQRYRTMTFTHADRTQAVDGGSGAGGLPDIIG